MSIELDKPTRERAVASIQRYFELELEQPVGNITAGRLLGYILDEIAPSIYNRAVTDVQERLLARIQELDIEVHEDEFAYWPKQRPRK